MTSFTLAFNSHKWSFVTATKRQGVTAGYELTDYIKQTSFVTATEYFTAASQETTSFVTAMKCFIAASQEATNFDWYSWP